MLEFQQDNCVLNERISMKKEVSTVMCDIHLVTLAVILNIFFWEYLPLITEGIQ